LKICLVGDYSIPDEARKVIIHNLRRELSKNNEVLIADIRNLTSVKLWRRVRDFEPQILHYIPGASPISFMITKLMKILSRKPKTVMFSMLHPFHSPFYSPYYFLSNVTKVTIPFLKTDLVIVQSDWAEQVFRQLNCNVKFLPCSGVDIKKFIPVPQKKKEELREKYGVDPNKFVVLHIGSIKKWRNVEILKEIQKSDDDVQVVVVGRLSGKSERDVITRLEKIGCRIINTFIPRIEELYALADCYIFPTIDPVGSIDIPLSVLEAMSTNLPVISTMFGGLPRIFKEGNGFMYANGINDFIQKIKILKDNDSINVKTRALVLPYSWENIAKKLVRIYEELLD